MSPEQQNWKQQVTDGVLGQTSQERGHISHVYLEQQGSAKQAGGANWKEHYVRRHRGNSGCSLWFLDTGLCRAARALPCSLKTMLSDQHQVGWHQRGQLAHARLTGLTKAMLTN